MVSRDTFVTTMYLVVHVCLQVRHHLVAGLRSAVLVVIPEDTLMSIFVTEQKDYLYLVKKFLPYFFQCWLSSPSTVVSLVARIWSQASAAQMPSFSLDNRPCIHDKYFSTWEKQIFRIASALT